MILPSAFRLIYLLLRLDVVCYIYVVLLKNY